MGNSHRLERVGRVLKDHISALILSGEIKDPRVTPMLVITHVEVSRDLAHAKVRVSTFQEHRRLDRAVEGLNSAGGFIQSIIAGKIRMRGTPRLVFVADHSIEEAFDVTAKIKEVLS